MDALRETMGPTAACYPYLIIFMITLLCFNLFIAVISYSFNQIQTEVEEEEEKAAARMKREFLCIIVDSCAGLKDLETVSVSDPFVKVILKLADGTIQEFKTEVKDGDLNPEFKETFEFEMTEEMRTAGEDEATLTFEVWDENNVVDDMMGMITYKLSELGVAPDPENPQVTTRTDALKGLEEDEYYGTLTFLTVGETMEQRDSSGLEEPDALLARRTSLASEGNVTPALTGDTPGGFFSKPKPPATGGFFSKPKPPATGGLFSGGETPTIGGFFGGKPANQQRDQISDPNLEFVSNPLTPFFSRKPEKQSIILEPVNRPAPAENCTSEESDLDGWSSLPNVGKGSGVAVQSAFDGKTKRQMRMHGVRAE